MMSSSNDQYQFPSMDLNDLTDPYQTAIYFQELPRYKSYGPNGSDDVDNGDHVLCSSIAQFVYNQQIDGQFFLDKFSYSDFTEMLSLCTLPSTVSIGPGSADWIWKILSHSIKFSLKETTAISMESLDLNIFNEPDTRCDRNSDDIPITEKCSHLKRLCTALMYSDAINQSTKLSDDDKKLLFVEFNEEIYNSVIDDVAHLVKEHENDINRISDEWTRRYGHSKCSVTHCVKTERHYRGRRRERKKKKENEEDDALYYFYESLFDRIHFYVFHLYDVGLRVNAEALTLNEDGSDEKEKGSEGVTVDKVFAAEREHIMMRRKELNMESERMSRQNTKFSIQTVNEQQGMTLRDAAFDELSEKMEVQKVTLQNIHQFVERNDFDSDAMDMDLEDIRDSNLYGLIQNHSVVETTRKFIRSINLRRAAFSTGFGFKYNGKVLKSNDNFFVLDIPEELNVIPKYANLKEEIIESGYLSHSKWMELVHLKGTKYWNESEIVTAMDEWGYYELPLEHLFVIILYCDFTKLCTAFSGTYRRENVFESVESVVSRHSEFGHFGELLAEVVNTYGISGEKGNGAQREESGPFYCGINCILNIGSFAITLKGPNSTSTVKEVAVNFADERGMILKLDNDSGFAMRQHFFDCSWISNYCYEQERLWIAGQIPLRIVSIVLIQSAKNYWKAMRALYCFDAMISSIGIDDELKKTVDQSDYDLISKLMDWTLNGGDIGSSEFDSFLQNEWNLFLQRDRKEIILELETLDNKHQFLSELVMFNVVKNGVFDYERKAILRNAIIEKDNVLKPEWISMFPSVRTVTITTGGYYQFRLDALLESMQSISPLITVIVDDTGIQGRWIENELNDDISSAFDAAGWNIEYRTFEHLREGPNTYRIQMRGLVIKPNSS